MEAIGEGFGDYLAGTVAADANADPACLGEWDSSASAEATGCLRRVDGNRQYPDGLTSDAHVDGEIWSRLLWDLRAAVGADVTDKLARTARSSYGRCRPAGWPRCLRRCWKRRPAAKW